MKIIKKAVKLYKNKLGQNNNNFKYEGFWNGIFNWKKHLEFVVTQKGTK